MSNITVERADTNTAVQFVKPDFIYNRPDLYSKNPVYYKVTEGEKVLYVGADIQERGATLGIWLVDISEAALKALIACIFREHKKLRYIFYEYSFCKLEQGSRTDHMRIELPETAEELRARTSAKSRYNIKRERRLMETDFGSCTLTEYTADTVPEELIRRYFAMKEQTMGARYDLNAREYLDKYHVTDVYVLSAGEKTVAMIMSCEACPIVYVENMTYDGDLSWYSPGQVLYDLYLERLIQKGKKDVYLGGAKRDYKKKYGSIQEETYWANIYRSKLTEFGVKLRRLAGRVKRRLLKK